MKTPVLLLTFAVLARSVLAADVTGAWKSEFDSQIGLQKYTFTFKRDGANLTGNANSEVGDRKREAELKEGKVNGDEISFVEILTVQENDIRISYNGKLSTNGNEIKFTREVGDFAKEEIVARREQTAPVATAGTTAVPAASAAATTTAAAIAPAATPVLQIDASKVTGSVSPMLYGLMTEEINFSYEGGLYGELIRNRTFKVECCRTHFLECRR